MAGRPRYGPEQCSAHRSGRVPTAPLPSQTALERDGTIRLESHSAWIGASIVHVARSAHRRLTGGRRPLHERPFAAAEPFDGTALWPLHPDTIAREAMTILEATFEQLAKHATGIEVRFRHGAGCAAVGRVVSSELPHRLDSLARGAIWQ